MHFVLTLYDAPVPARGALAALLAAGVDAMDIAVVPSLRVDEATGTRNLDLSLPTAPDELARTLLSWGLPPDDAGTFAEGVKRGAILIAVRTPTLSATTVRAVMGYVGALALPAHRARWQADPAFRYGWSQVPAPDMAVGHARSSDTPIRTDDTGRAADAAD